MIEPQYNELSDSLSRDSLFDGDLICFQHRNGYRFSIDSVLISHFLDVKQGDRILDLGTGSGIISMILMYRWRCKVKEVTGIEVQPGLAELARKNFRANSFEQSCRVWTCNIKEINIMLKPESYEKIVCNPPFYTPASGRTNKNSESRIARHQILATLHDFLSASAFAVKNGGAVYFIYPAARMSEFISFAEKIRLAVKKIQFVYSYPNEDAPARLILIQCIKNGGAGNEVLPPFYIYCEKNGDFSPEMQNFYKKNKE